MRYMLFSIVPICISIRDWTGSPWFAQAALLLLQNDLFFDVCIASADLLVPAELAGTAFRERSLFHLLAFGIYLVVHVLYHETRGTFQCWMLRDMVMHCMEPFGAAWQFAKAKWAVAWPVIREWYPWAAMGQVECPMHGDLKKGILNCLKKKHGGFFTFKAVVATTQGEIEEVRPPGERPRTWVCWDFGDKAVRVERYALNRILATGWFVEASWDGERWIEIDRQTRLVRAGEDLRCVAYTVSCPVEARFVKITDANRHGIADVPLEGIEFFGTLFE
jgi:hypothetical protein